VNGAVGAMQESADPDPLAPRRNPTMVGHAEAEDLLRQDAEAGRLAHAIILGGPRGIGKATLAYRFARWLLARGREGEMIGPSDGLTARRDGLSLDPAHPVARRVASGGHADLFSVERGWDARRKKLRGEILVEDVRAIAGFLQLTPAEGGWRIVIVDSADEMNRNAANALLKILEEPPKRALLLLVCHAPGRLLPTIRSRCRRLSLQPLAVAEIAALLRQQRPQLDESDTLMLARLGDGSIGRALELAEAGGIALYRTLTEVINRLPTLDIQALHRLADGVAGSDGEERFETLTALLIDFLERLIAGTADGVPRSVMDEEAALLRRLGDPGRLDRWVEVWETLRALFGRTDAVNLDRKLVLLDAFFTLETAAR
jgi:DNA polymerase III subunit delta'